MKVTVYIETDKGTRSRVLEARSEAEAIGIAVLSAFRIGDFNHITLIQSAPHF